MRVFKKRFVTRIPKSLLGKARLGMPSRSAARLLSHLAAGKEI